MRVGHGDGDRRHQLAEEVLEVVVQEGEDDVWFRGLEGGAELVWRRFRAWLGWRVERCDEALSSNVL